MRFYQVALQILGIILLLGANALAQTATGSISGVVQDESGAVIPRASVTVTNVDTGISRSVVTGAGGRYRVPSLIPARYEVQVEMTGFETAVRRGIQLTVGSDLEINMVLKVGQVTQQTVVTAEAPLVETLTGTVSGLVDDKAIRDLPLNGRSFDQLIALQSSVPRIRLMSTSGIVSGTSATYAVHGARDQANRFLLDGTEVLRAGLSSNLPGGSLGLNMGVEAIREFSVLTSNYGASYGKKMGAIINIASRSGTNEFHGSAFEFHRNSVLDARNFFDREIPPFRRNQFGGALGGPIRKDQTFFFGTYEGLREALGLSVIQGVPDDNSRQAAVPAVKPFLAAFPVANGRNFGDGTAEAVFSPTRVGSENFYLGRIDHRLSDKDSFFARYNFSNDAIFPVSNIIYWGLRVPSSIQVVTLEETRAYSATVNTIRAGFTRSTLASDSIPTIPLDPSLVFLPGAKSLGIINFSLAVTTGLTGVAQGALSGQGASQGNRRYALNQFAVGDALFHQRGPHSLQLGVQVQRLQQHISQPDNPFGNFQFTDLTSLLTGKPVNFSGPDLFGGGDPTKAYRQTYLAAYLQDDYKVRRNLTLNLGLRWEFMTPPTEASGNRISNYHVHLENGLSVLDTNPTLGSPFYSSRKKNFAPRLGFAWDILGDGKTAVRGGVGMFYDQVESEFKARTPINRPFYGTLQVPNPPFPLGFSGGAGTTPLPVAQALDTNLAVPVRLQYNLNVQRQITSNTALTIGYVGSEAYHLARPSDLNTTRPQVLPVGVRFYPANAPRLNPSLAGSNFISTDATSSYQGLDLEVTQRFSRGLRYKVSFTYSKNIDTSSAIFPSFATGSPGSTMQPDNLRLDRGLSNFDVRRNLVANFTYDLPWQNSTRAAVRWIGGWQVGAILTLADGMPFTALTGFNRSGDRASTVADRPDLLPGRNKNPVWGGPDKYFDSSVFGLPPAGFYGNLGRNTLISPGFVNFDCTLTKVFPVSERLKVDFRAEFFNFVNRANFGLPNNTIFNANGTFRGNTGRISSTVTTSRQIQFGLKLLF